MNNQCTTSNIASLLLFCCQVVLAETETDAIRQFYASKLSPRFSVPRFCTSVHRRVLQCKAVDGNLCSLGSEIRCAHCKAPRRYVRYQHLACTTIWPMVCRRQLVQDLILILSIFIWSRSAHCCCNSLLLPGRLYMLQHGWSDSLLFAYLQLTRAAVAEQKCGQLTCCEDGVLRLSQFDSLERFPYDHPFCC